MNKTLLLVTLSFMATMARAEVLFSLPQLETQPGQTINLAWAWQSDGQAAALQGRFDFDSMLLSVTSHDDCLSGFDGSTLFGQCLDQSGTADNVFFQILDTNLQPLSQGGGELSVTISGSASVGSDIALNWQTETVVVDGHPSLQFVNGNIRVVYLTGAVLVGPDQPSLVGESVEFQIDVGGPDGPPDVGAVIVEADDGQSCQDPGPPAMVGDQARFSCSISFETVGELQLTASYSGSASHASAESEPISHTITTFPASLQIKSVSPPGSQLAFTPYQVHMTLDAYFPQGMITVTDDLGASCQVAASTPKPFCILSSDTVGERLLTASYAGDDNNLGAEVTKHYDILPGPAHSLAFQLQPSTTVLGEPISPAVEVALLDPHGNIISWDNETSIMLKLIGGDPDAVLSGGQAVVSQGIAVFDSLLIDRPGSDFRLEALDSNEALPTALSESFQVMHDPIFSSRFEDHGPVPGP